MPFIFGLSLDWTFNVGDLLTTGIMFLGGIYAFIKTFVQMRDVLRDLLRTVGTEEPPTGLVGDVHEIKLEQRLHRDWLVAAGIDRRRNDRLSNDKQ